MLALWEGWCVFPQASQERFAAVFEKPPATRREVEEEERGREAERERERGARGRWKAVEERAREREREREGDGDVDGEAMLEEGEEGLDGEPMGEEDVDGESMLEDEDEAEEPVKETHAGPALGFKMAAPVPEAAKTDNVPPARRRRPKAEDMFADSDGE